MITVINVAYAAPTDPILLIMNTFKTVFTTLEKKATPKLNFSFLCVTNNVPGSVLNVLEKAKETLNILKAGTQSR